MAALAGGTRAERNLISMAQKGKAKRGQKERETGRTRERDDDISRITRTMRQKEHMGYPGQSHAGDDEVVRHLFPKLREQVMQGSKSNV